MTGADNSAASATAAPRSVFLTWQPATHFGWGIVGVQIALHWCREGRLLPVMHSVRAEEIAVDPVRLGFLEPMIRASAAFERQLQQMPRDRPMNVNVPVVHSMGNRASCPFGNLRGVPNIGRIVFEDTDFAPDAIGRLQRMDVLTVISNWNGEILRQVTDRQIVVNHEGIDASHFFPGPRSGLWDPSRFYVFSGGKAELRKGQDLILAAFRIFSERHPEAVLVTAWQSPFPSAGTGLQGVLGTPLRLDATGRSLDVRRWAAENGVDAVRIVEIGIVPNVFMPFILREMDCANCASRAEGGTNLPAMEAMACGVPVIVPRNTGMQDLIAPGNSVVLERQTAVKAQRPRSALGWCDSDVDEIVGALEMLFTSSSLRQRVGQEGARFMQQRSWKAHAERLAALVEGRSAG